MDFLYLKCDPPLFINIGLGRVTPLPLYYYLKFTSLALPSRSKPCLIIVPDFCPFTLNNPPVLMTICYPYFPY